VRSLLCLTHAPAAKLRLTARVRWARRAGRGGLHRQWAGFAFEPQGSPNAPNQPNFPSPILRSGEVYRQSIVYRLAVAHPTIDEVGRSGVDQPGEHR
jgi:aldose 1-epimerase